MLFGTFEENDIHIIHYYIHYIVKVVDTFSIIRDVYIVRVVTFSL